MQDQVNAYGQQQQQQNYYDSIETDEFVMPTTFEVEIRLADNQVSEYQANSLIGENRYGCR